MTGDATRFIVTHRMRDGSDVVVEWLVVSGDGDK